MVFLTFEEAVIAGWRVGWWLELALGLGLAAGVWRLAAGDGAAAGGHLWVLQRRGLEYVRDARDVEGRFEDRRPHRPRDPLKQRVNVYERRVKLVQRSARHFVVTYLKISMTTMLPHSSLCASGARQTTGSGACSRRARAKLEAAGLASTRLSPPAREAA
jgi:hypothetical protein